MSLIRRYNSLLYAARATASTFKRVKDWHRGQTQTRAKHPVVEKVRAKTRGRLAGHPTAYDPGRLSGQKRRNELAKKIKAQRKASGPGKRKHSGPQGEVLLRRIQKYPGKITLERGMSHRQIMGRVRQYSRRQQIGGLLKQHGGNNPASRKKVAGVLRAMRAFSPGSMKHQPTLTHDTGKPQGLYAKALRNYKRAFMKKK